MLEGPEQGMGVPIALQTSDPREVGAYRVESVLGRGATASVYRCRHKTLGRLAAIKVLHPHFARSEVALRRFMREGRALSRIGHPNVVEVHDVGEHHGVPFLIMSLVEGEDLGAYHRRHHPMTPTAIADCVLQVIDGVAAAHDAGIIHRDLKPSNIRIALDRDGGYLPKLLDFGISKVEADGRAGDLTASDALLGTVGYMAPEQLRSAGKADARSDVYAIGVILYELATGQRPFETDRSYDTMHAIVTSPARPPRALRSDLPPEWDALILRAMARDPSKRHPSIRSLGRALAPFASQPDRWLEALSNGEPTTVPPASPLDEPAMPSVTLASQGGRSAGLRWRSAVLAGTGIALLSCAAAALAAKGTARQLDPPLGSDVPGVPVAEPVRAVTKVASEQDESAPSSSDSVRPRPHARPPVPRTHVRAESSPSSPPGRSVAAVPSRANEPELGANGSPIIE